MARSPVPKQRVELLQPAASPVDPYVAPQRSSLHDLAESLSKLDRPLRQFMSDRAEKQKREDELRGEAAFYNDNEEGLAEGVRSGKIPAHFSPAFVRGFKGAQGNVAGNNLRAKFNAAFDAWEGKNSEDPAAFDEFFKEWVATEVGTDDPDVLAGLLPHIREIQSGGTGRFIEYRHQQTYQGSLDANIAGANQDIDAATEDGLASPAGTDYPAVFAAIEAKRAAFVSKGGRPQDFDKAMVDAMSAKILATRDPGLLGWFEQKVPGTDHTYGDSPYGLAVKQNTVEALEVIARRSETEDSVKQKAADEKAKDDAHRQTVELLATDPNAPLPDGLIAAGRKFDPTFDVRVQEWRRALGTGFTDPSKLKAVYSAILDGGGFKAVSEAASAGVFGRPEDLTAAYTFAKGFEDNKDRISDVLGGTVAKDFMNAIDVRTKGKTELGDPISGMSNEGFEATYDFRRMVQEWVVNNPDATLQEQEEAINKIGKTVLDRVQAGEDEQFDPGTYERPEELGERFENPYTDGTAPISPATQGQDEEANGEVQDFLDGMTPEQRAVIDQQAKERGVTPEKFAEEMLGGQPEATPQSAPGETPAASNIAFRPNEGRQNGFTPAQAQAFLDDALAAGQDSSIEVVTQAGGNRAVGRLLDLIGKHEARGNYNAVYGNARATRDLSQLTVNQILAQQVVARRRGAASTAIGKYQFIYKTLRGLKSELGLKGTERFTPQLQDRLAIALLKRRGLDGFLSGRVSKRSFALGLSQEWASLPNPNTGRSFYAGDGLNASSVRTASVYRELGLLSAPPERPTTRGPVADAYSDIPDVDSSGNSGQRAKFAEWNSDPIANHEQNLKTIEPTLANVVRKAQSYGGIDFVVGSGKRDQKLQAKAVDWGWSKTDESDHLHGDAVDLWPIVKGKVKFDPKAQKLIIKNMKRAAKELGVDLDIGGEWKSFKDMPHFALRGVNT